MLSPKITVVMTTHHGRRDFCKKAVESVLHQIFPDWELIIVDDGSRDGTDEMMAQFRDQRIVYIHRKKCFGNDTKPKNEGIAKAKAQYIAFLDSDNQYRPDHLAVLMNTMEREDVDVVYGDRWIIDEENRIPSQLGFTMDFDPPALMQRNFIDTSDVLVKREALIAVGGFDETIKKYIDWNVWVRMLKNGATFQHVPIVITDYYLHSSMKSETVKTKGDKPGKFVPEWDAIECDVELPYLKEVKLPKVAVYSITYDRLDYTKKSFKSLRDTAGYPYDHFVIDNGSTDGTENWLEGYDGVVIFNVKNTGISHASNQAIDEIKAVGGYDIIVKWDDDAIGLTKGWLFKMVEIWKSNHMAALSCYIQGLKDHPGGAPRIGYGMIKGELLGITKHLGGICHFVDARAYKDFRWDDNSFLHGVQDMEFSQYLLIHKFLQAYLENFYVNHGIGGTEQQKKDYPSYFERRVSEKRTRYEE